MNFRIFISVFFVLVVLLGCETKAEQPEGLYQSTSYNTGKKVVFDFEGNGEVSVKVTHVNVSGKVVDDTFFPFFSDGENRYKWKMGEKDHLVSIYTENGFEIVKLEYTGKYLAWDKTKFTRE